MATREEIRARIINEMYPAAPENSPGTTPVLPNEQPSATPSGPVDNSREAIRARIIDEMYPAPAQEAETETEAATPAAPVNETSLFEATPEDLAQIYAEPPGLFLEQGRNIRDALSMAVGGAQTAAGAYFRANSALADRVAGDQPEGREFLIQRALDSTGDYLTEVGGERLGRVRERKNLPNYSVYNDVARAVNWDEEGFDPWYTAGFVAANAPSALVDGGIALVSLPAFIMATGGRAADERAFNDGREEPNFEDMMIGLGVGTVTGFTERFGMGASRLKDLFKMPAGPARSRAIRILAGTAREGTTEAAQEALEYTATHLGTDRGFDTEQAMLSAIGGALIGAPLGGGLGALQRNPEQPIDEGDGDGDVDPLADPENLDEAVSDPDPDATIEQEITDGEVTGDPFAGNPSESPDVSGGQPPGSGVSGVTPTPVPPAPTDINVQDQGEAVNPTTPQNITDLDGVNYVTASDGSINGQSPGNIYGNAGKALEQLSNTMAENDLLPSNVSQIFAALSAALNDSQTAQVLHLTNQLQQQLNAINTQEETDVDFESFDPELDDDPNTDIEADGPINIDDLALDFEADDTFAQSPNPQPATTPVVTLPTQSMIFNDESPTEAFAGLPPVNPPSVTPWQDTEDSSFFAEAVEKGKVASAGAIIIEPDGRVWTINPKGGFGGYNETFPKGQVDDGETAAQAAVREVKEETGIDIEITGALGNFERTTSHNRYYIARRIGGKPGKTTTGETAQVNLVPRSELVARLTAEPDQELIKAFEEWEAAPSPAPSPTPTPTPAPAPKGSPSSVPPGTKHGLTVNKILKDFPDYQYFGPKEGSVPGAIFLDTKTNKKVLVKHMKKEKARAQEEVLAANLFDRVTPAFLRVPTIRVKRGDSSKDYYVVSDWIEGLTSFDPKNESHRTKAEESYVASAWLANWDVFGAVWDNVLAGPNGELYFIDFGGSLSFRAQGEKKGLKFGSSAKNDLANLKKSSINPKTSNIYAGLSGLDIEQQVLRLVTSVGGILSYYKGKADQNVLNKLVLRLESIVEITNLKNSLGENQLESINLAIFERDTHAAKKAAKAASTAAKEQTVPTKSKTSAPPGASNPGTKTVKISNQAENIVEIEDAAQVYSHFNEKVNWSYPTNSATAKFYARKDFLEMLKVPGFKTWVEGNALWWDPVNNKQVVEPLTLEAALSKGLVPQILFHGIKNKKVVWFTNPETGQQIPYDMYKSSEAGKGVGGSDTSQGMFLEENPEAAAGWASGQKLTDETLDFKKMYKSRVLPLVIKMKNPWIVDYGGEFWSPSYVKEVSIAAKKKGYDGLIIRNMKDSNGNTQIILFNPSGKSAKSPFAVNFDPNKDTIYHSLAGESKIHHQLTPALQAELEAELRKFSLHTLINLKTFPFKGQVSAVFGKDVSGFYIGLANIMPSKYGIKAEFRHEMIHALKFMGFFDSPEGKRMWRILENKVKQDGVPQDIQDKYDRSNWTEEAIARMAAEWTAGQTEAKTPLQKAFKAIKNFWEALGNWARRQGWVTAEDALANIFDGDPSTASWIKLTQDSQMDGIEQEIAKSVTVLNNAGIKTQSGKADYYARLSKMGWSILQVARVNEHIAWLQEYVQIARLWHMEKSKRLLKANRTIGMWNSLHSESQNAVSKLLFAVENLEYLTPVESQKGIRRQPTQAEEITLMKKYKVTKEGAKVYYTVKKDFAEVLDKMEQVALTDITKSTTDPDIADLNKSLIQMEFKNLRRTPYFPHTRFGTYTVSVRDKDGQLISMEAFETKNQRKAGLREVKKKYPPGNQFAISEGKLTEEQKVYQGLPSSMLKLMKEKLNLNSAQTTIIDTMIANNLPSVSFKNHFVKRKNIAGFSEDGMRGYADYFMHAANHIARIEYAPMMQERISQADKDISAMNKVHGTDTTKRQEIRDHLVTHLERMINPVNDWAGLRGVTFLYWLGFSVKSALVNYTQTPLVTYSYLGANYGDARATAALTAATTQLRKSFKNPNGPMSPENKRFFEFISRGLEEGFLDESFAAELAGLAEGMPLLMGRSRSSAAKNMDRFNHYAGYMFQSVEKINRRTAFIAASNLAYKYPDAAHNKVVRKRFSIEYPMLLDKGMSTREATSFLVGKAAVEDTQFNYAAWARPQLMTGKVSVIFTFFTFAQNMLWFMRYSPGRGRYLLVLLIMGGLMGLPFAEDLEEIINALGKRLSGKDFDMQNEIRSVLGPVFDEYGIAPDLFLRGASRYGFGLPLLGDAMGVPLPSTDVSANIGMGSPVPIISPLIKAAARSADGVTSWRENKDTIIGDFAQEAGGPSLAMGFRLYDALTNRSGDPLEYLKRGAPNAVASVAKAFQWHRDGGETAGASRALIQRYDRNNPAHMMELIAQGIGFSPTRRSQMWEERIAVNEAAAYWGTRRQNLSRIWREATWADDAEGVAEANERIKLFNETVPYPSARITQTQLNLGLAAATRHKEASEDWTIPGNVYADVVQNVRSLRPENADIRPPPRPDDDGAEAEAED